MTKKKSVTPIPGKAAAAIEKEARDRLGKVNPHLLRVTNEVQKMMLWHQYAAHALSGIFASGACDDKYIVQRACQAADLMMEEIKERKIILINSAIEQEHFDTTPVAVMPSEAEQKKRLDQWLDGKGG